MTRMLRALHSRPFSPLSRLSPHRHGVEHGGGAFVGLAGADLKADHRLDGGEVLGVDVEGRGVGRQRIVVAPGEFERQREVVARVGVPGQEFAGPLELGCRVVELALPKQQRTEVVVGGAVIKIGGLKPRNLSTNYTAR